SRILGDRGELRDEIGEGGIATAAAEPHLGGVFNRLGDLIFESGGTFIPKEMKLAAEPGVRQAHGMTSSRARNAAAHTRDVTESMLLLVAGAATHRFVA